MAKKKQQFAPIARPRDLVNARVADKQVNMSTNGGNCYGLGTYFGPGWHDGTPEGLAFKQACYGSGNGLLGNEPTYTASTAPPPPATTTRPPVWEIGPPPANYPTQNTPFNLTPGVFNPLSPASGGNSMPPPFQSSTGGLAGGVVGSIGSAACGFITNATARAICMATAGVVGGALSGGGQQGQQGGGSGAGPTNCPTGYVSDGAGGCKLAGMAPYIPGDIGRADYVFTPTYGYYGIAATPATVTRATRVCPSGFVLGKDGLCYDHLPARARAHNPGRKPMLTGGDLNALARARQLQKAIGKLNTRFGPKKRPKFLPARKK